MKILLATVFVLAQATGSGMPPIPQTSERPLPSNNVPALTAPPARPAPPAETGLPEKSCMPECEKPRGQ